MINIQNLDEIQAMESTIDRIAKLLKCKKFEVADRVEALFNRIKLLEKERNKLGGS